MARSCWGPASVSYCLRVGRQTVTSGLSAAKAPYRTLATVAVAVPGPETARVALWSCSIVSARGLQAFHERWGTNLDGGNGSKSGACSGSGCCGAPVPPLVAVGAPRSASRRALVQPSGPVRLERVQGFAGNLRVSAIRAACSACSRWWAAAVSAWRCCARSNWASARWLCWSSSSAARRSSRASRCSGASC